MSDVLFIYVRCWGDCERSSVSVFSRTAAKNGKEFVRSRLSASAVLSVSLRLDGGHAIRDLHLDQREAFGLTPAARPFWNALAISCFHFLFLVSCSGSHPRLHF